MQVVPITVRLWVKAHDAAGAQAIAERRLKLVDWFCEEGTIIVGQGYPEGSLLFYKVEALAIPPQSIPQIQG